MKKEKTGVVVMHEDKAWGVIYDDNHSISYGWVDLIDADIHNPEFCKKVTDVTYPASPYIPELLKGKLVRVLKTTSITIKEIA